MEDLLQVGAITQTHGIKGEVKVFPTTDDVQRFLKLKTVLLDTGKEKIELEIENVKFFKQFVILKFKGIDYINDVEIYKGKNLYVTRKNAVSLKKGEYFIADLIGLCVVDEAGEKVGTVTDVLKTNANDVYEVKTENNTTVLLPAIRECILDIDLTCSTMKIHKMEGLF